MTGNFTYAMIKPGAVATGLTGKVIDRIESEGFRIVGMKKVQMSTELAQEFYAVHKERPFYGELVAGMTTGPIVALVLEKENAVQAWRDLIGATNPAQAAEGTIRKMYGTDITNNVVHGSDADTTAELESQLIFPELFSHHGDGCC